MIMRVGTIATLLFLGSTVTLLGSGCAMKRYYKDNPDVAAEYRDNKYNDDIVTARTRQDYAEQGAGIKPSTLTSIEATISNVYEKDFERCLEQQMDELGTRFIRSAFTVEFHIGTNGKASKPKILNIAVRAQDAKGADKGEVKSGPMKDCIAKAVATWEFDPAPEAEYVHTYRGQVGEAF